MTILELKDNIVELDEEGFVKDFSQWSVDVAPENLTYPEIFRVFREFLRWVRRLIDVGSFACCSAS
jgi:sulfur relay (sulfurtransferase) DsrC/TusE family protein